MTTEDKQLLLKDLCARLPYRTKIHIIGEGGEEIDADLTTSTIDYFESWTVKPYLRPMSSMIEEEEEEYNRLLMDVEYYPGKYFVVPATSVVDWLLEHHFDFRGLFKKGLALEAKEDTYIKTKEG